MRNLYANAVHNKLREVKIRFENKVTDVYRASGVILLPFLRVLLCVEERTGPSQFILRRITLLVWQRWNENPLFPTV